MSAPAPRTADRRTAPERVGAALGVVGATLGVATGFVELTVGSSIRSWIGDKDDPIRLGIVTVVLSSIALASALVLARRVDGGAGRAALALGMLVPGLICFTTVGRLWYLPGLLLVTAAASVATRADVGSSVAVARRNWTSILAGTLGALYLALGLTAHGLAAVLGVTGGLTTVGLVIAGRHVPRWVGIPALALATAPFALATWWSLVTPLLAVLIVVLAAFATRPPCWDEPALGDRRGRPQRVDTAPSRGDGVERRDDLVEHGLIGLRGDARHR